MCYGVGVLWCVCVMVCYNVHQTTTAMLEMCICLLTGEVCFIWGYYDLLIATRFTPLRSVSDVLVRDVDCAVDCVCNHFDELDSLLTSSASRLLY